MKKSNFITITGIDHYYGAYVYKVGGVLELVKEEDNHFDRDAVRVELPAIGKAGYVANSMNTIVKGTDSASRIARRIPARCSAIVRFIANDTVVAEIDSQAISA